MRSHDYTTIEGKQVVQSGVLPRLAKLRSEYHDYIDSPENFLLHLKNANTRADVFTFLQALPVQTPTYDYVLDWDEIAVLAIDTYENWWKCQINDKTRNMVRKAAKKGVLVRQVEFSNDLAKGIHEIYNESPLLQGKPSKHYGKDFETLKKAHATFLAQSTFLGAFHGDALIGFIKLIWHSNGQSASIMQIQSLVAHRDKAPANALLAKAIETCAERGIHYLQYGIW